MTTYPCVHTLVHVCVHECVNIKSKSRLNAFLTLTLAHMSHFLSLQCKGGSIYNTHSLFYIDILPLVCIFASQLLTGQKASPLTLLIISFDYSRLFS